MPVVPDGITIESIQAEFQKVLASKRFAASERHCRLLRYLLEHTLRGHGGQLKEYVLAVEVFGRGEAFDPQTDPIVRTELSRLRAKLKSYYESEGRDDALIIDLPYRSYSLSFDLKQPPAPSPAVQAPRNRSRRKWIAASIVPLAIACLWVAAVRGRSGGNRERSERNPLSLAVLPFVNLSGDPETERFSDGLTEELIHCLAEVDGLRVISRTSAFHFKGRQEDLRAIAAQLNVGMVLEGAVRRSGDRLRITTRLLSTPDGRQLRSHAIERGLQDVHNVQQEIARQLASALRINQIGGRHGFAIRRFTDSAEAYDQYLEGRYRANKRSEPELRRAIECYQRAIAADPDYAAALASLADAHILLTLMNEERPHEAMQRARQAARHAVKTGDALSEAHVALGSVLALHDRDWIAAEKEFRRAIELDPNDSGVREAHAMRYLLPRGQLDSALFEMQLAESLDPFSPEVVLGLGKVHYFKGDPDRSIQTLERVLHLDSSFEVAPLALAAAYVQKSLVNQALSTLQGTSAPTEDEARLAVLGHAYALSRQPDRARQVLRQLGEVARQRYVSGYYFALVHAALGEKAKALDWLEKADAERCPLIVYLPIDPQFEGLRAEPRFRAILQKAGLSSTL